MAYKTKARKSRFRPRIASRTAPNPLRIDPSRTAGLRKDFAAALAKRFNALRQELIELVAVEDVFGLAERQDVFNSFCPTGKGGGVDPTCSPGKNTISSRASEDYIRYGTEMNAALRSGGQSEYQESIDNLTKEIDRSSLDKPLTVFRGVSLERGDEYSRMLTSEGSEFTDAGFTSTNRWTSGIIDTVKLFTPPDKFALVSIRLPEGSKAAHNEIGETVIQRGTTYKVSSVTRDEKGSYAVVLDVVRQRGVTANVFCATGPGGGVDPSCSPSGSRVTLGGKDISIDFDSEVTSRDTIAKVKGWLDSIPKDELAKSVAKKVEVYDNPEDLQRRLDEVGIEMDHGPDGLTRGAFDFSTGTLYASVWDGHQNSPRTLFHEIGHSILGMDEDRAESWAQKYSPLGFVGVLNQFCATGPGGGKDPTCSPGGQRSGSKLSLALSQARMLPAKTLAKIKEVAKSKHAQLEKRYGPKYAKAIIGAAMMLAPTTTLALIGVAEMHRLISRPKPTENMEEDEGVEPAITEEQINEAARKLIEELERELQEATQNQRWSFRSNPDKIAAFKDWLKTQITKHFSSDDKLWEAYIQAGFRKGAGRSFDETKLKKLRKERPDLFTQGAQQSLSDFYLGSKDQFLRSAFNSPIAVEKVKLLAGRAFDQLSGITEQMASTMGHVLTDGLVQGKGPRQVASDLASALDISKGRAERIARTEIVRAHAEGQLTALESLGVEQVGVSVEWSTTGDRKVCKLCRPMQGVVMTIAEARKHPIPRHPSCRCAWTPAGVGEDDANQKKTKAQIVRALKASVEKENSKKGSSWPGADIDIAKKRPEGIGIFNHLLPASLVLNWISPALSHFLTNVFCPNGPGGGINPHCSPGGAQLHATGLTVGSTFTKKYKGNNYTVTVEANGFKIDGPTGAGTYSSIGEASVAVTGNKTIRNGWRFFGIQKPTGPNPPPPKQTPATPPPVVTKPQSTVPVIAYKDEHDFETGKPQPGILNGIPFSTAPPKFWEKTPDAKIVEHAPVNKIVRSTVMIEEPDGRVWIVQPTNGFGDRKYTLPGGTNEKHLTNQQNALKEVWEETGLQVEITGHLGDFQDSNYANTGSPRWGRLYKGKRIGGAPWDAKIESTITNHKTGQPAAESEKVSLVTKEIAAKRLHRTDDLAQLATVAPIALETNPKKNVMSKIIEGIKPIEETWRKSQNSVNKAVGDPTLHAVQELRGFNGKPTEVSRAAMDNLIASGGHIEMMRGIKGSGSLSAKDLTNDFKRGDHYPGFGCFGSGTYADSNRGSGNVATGQYGRGGDVVRIALPKTAKIIKQSELEKKVSGHPSNYSPYSTHSTTDSWLGAHAALAGYDAIHVDGNSSRHGSYGKGFYVILNRSILTVQKETAKGHVIQ